MSPIAASSAAAVTKLTPGRVSSRRISVEASTCSASARSISAISPSRNSIWRRQAATVSCSSAGSSCAASQRRPRTPNRSLTGGLPFRLRISVACTWFFARVRCRTSCARAEIRRRRIRVCSSGSQTAGRKPPASSFASVRASILSVFAPARVIPLTAFGFASTTRPTCGSMIRAIPSALPVASSATSSSPPRLCANSSSAAGSVCTRPASRTSPRLRDRDLAEVAMHVQPDEPHRTPPPLSVVDDGDEAGDTTTTDPCARHTRTVAGAATYKQRARSP